MSSAARAYAFLVFLIIAYALFLGTIVTLPVMAVCMAR